MDAFIMPVSHQKGLSYFSFLRDFVFDAEDRNGKKKLGANICKAGHQINGMVKRPRDGDYCHAASRRRCKKLHGM